MRWLGTYVARARLHHLVRALLRAAQLAADAVARRRHGAVLFFFFEVTLRTLLPKGITEPLFCPLYQIFF